MKYLLAVLLILIASYADRFLFRIGIIPFEPSEFLIPLFIAVSLVKYSVLDFWDLFKSHSFKIFAAILFLSLVYSSVSSAPSSSMITKISLDAITLFIYILAVQFFRNEDRWLVFLVVFVLCDSCRQCLV